MATRSTASNREFDLWMQENSLTLHLFTSLLSNLTIHLSPFYRLTTSSVAARLALSRHVTAPPKSNPLIRPPHIQTPNPLLQPNPKHLHPSTPPTLDLSFRLPLFLVLLFSLIIIRHLSSSSSSSSSSHRMLPRILPQLNPQRNKTIVALHDVLRRSLSFNFPRTPINHLRISTMFFRTPR